MAYDKHVANLRFRDKYNRTKSKRVEMTTLDPAQADIDSDIIKAAYDQVIDGFIPVMSVTGDKIYAGAAGANSNVDTGVTMSCQLDGRPEKAALKWPTPDPTILNPDGTVDLANLGVVAVQDLYVAGIGQVASLSDGEAITGFISGSLDK